MNREIKEVFTPDWWKSSLSDVDTALKLVKRGKITEMLPSAGKRPIYMIEYGSSNLPKRQANLSSALGARDYSCYANKKGADYVPTVFFMGCVHGGEFEGTVALLNLIKLIETGTDYKGERNDKLVELCEKVHLIIMPMCNPDGRSHVPFDNFVGRTFEDLRYYNQGTWRDGTLCGWPGCKSKFPIKEHVDYLGGYFNDDGINPMHDDFFTNPSNEVRNIISVCYEHAPDFSMMFHGGDNSVNHFFPVTYITTKARREICEVGMRLTERFDKEGYKFTLSGGAEKFLIGPEVTSEPAFQLTSAMHHCCGEPCITYESNQGLIKENSYCLDNDGIYRCHMMAIEETVAWTIENKSASHEG